MTVGLSDKFKHRFFRSIRTACKQLVAYPGPVDKRIVLLVVRFDSDHLFLGQNYDELATLIASQPVAGIEIVCQVSPP